MSSADFSASVVSLPSVDPTVDLPSHLQYSLVVANTGDCSGCFDREILKNVTFEMAEQYAEYLDEASPLPEGKSYEIFAPGCGCSS